jgi:hypothetical protein
MKINFLIVILFFLTACKKNSCPSSIKLSATSLTPTAGDDVIITAPDDGGTNVNYQWSGPFITTTTQSNKLRLDNIQLSANGTYKCVKDYSECTISLIDSVMINVKLKQETPPCSLTNNVITATVMPNITSFISVTQGYDGTYNSVSLVAWPGPGKPTITVLFNPSNGIYEPLDGTHYTTSGPAGGAYNELNEVSISFIYGGNYYHCVRGEKVYVTHSGGKLQVSFCNLVFRATTVPDITCSGKITES